MLELLNFLEESLGTLPELKDPCASSFLKCVNERMSGYAIRHRIGQVVGLPTPLPCLVGVYKAGRCVC
jgi:hypothetical protein